MKFNTRRRNFNGSLVILEKTRDLKIIIIIIIITEDYVRIQRYTATATFAETTPRAVDTLHTQQFQAPAFTWTTPAAAVAVR